LILKEECPTHTTDVICTEEIKENVCQVI
jgi:hypothetical protein